MNDLKSQPWLTYAEDMPIELQQCADEGKRVNGLKERAVALASLSATEAEQLAEELLDETATLPVSDNFPFNEPSDLASIKSLCTGWGRDELPRVEESRLYDKIHGAWLGRVAGCLLGKPVESWTRERIAGFNKAAGNYPIVDYMRNDHEAALIKAYDLSDISPLSGERNSWINLVDSAPVDDDTNYTVLALLAVEQFGHGITPEQIGYTWLNRLPVLQTFTAERIAYRNLVSKVLPPRSGSYRNIYREFIGAQIRADLWGYINPGQPAAAVEMARRDACISHVKNGLYGEMWAAAMISAALATDNLEEITQTGLGFIPRTSRLYAAVSRVIDLINSGGCFETLANDIHQRWDEGNFYHWAHTISNAEIVTAALLCGELDFTRSIGLAVSAGFDTDCNAATVGSIVGAVLGANALPQHWLAPLHDHLQTSVRGAEWCTISDLARRTHALIMT